MKISIIVPIYNSEKYLTECLDSLKNQTYNNIEIILVDDGSKDDSYRICSDYANKDNRFLVNRKENGGVHTARNFGISHATGEYVMFCDSDDWFDSDAVEKLVNVLNEFDFDVLRFNYSREYENNVSKKKINTIFNSDKKNISVQTAHRLTVGLIDDELKHPENFNFMASVCLGIYKRDVIVNNHIVFDDIKDISNFEDGLFNIKFLSKSNTFGFIDEHLYHYRKVNNASITIGYRRDLLNKQMLMLNMIKDNISDYIDGTEYMQAFDNRVSYTAVELCNNVMKNKNSLSEKYREIKEIIKHPLIKKSLRALKIKYMPIYWKAYYFLMKIGFVLPVLSIAAAFRFMQKRAVK